MECELQDGGHRLWENTATLKALDRGSIGLYPWTARGASPSILGQPMFRWFLCSGIREEVWSSECQSTGQTSKKKAVSLDPWPSVYRNAGGEGSAPGSHGKSGLYTLVPVSFLEQGLWELCPLSLPASVPYRPHTCCWPWRGCLCPSTSPRR